MNFLEIVSFFPNISLHCSNSENGLIEFSVSQLAQKAFESLSSIKSYAAMSGFKNTVQELDLVQKCVVARQWLKEQTISLLLHREEL